MKKRSIAIAGGVLLLAVIAVFASACFFPLTENDLTEAILYRFELEDTTQTSYAISYRKHLLFARYRFASYADYARPDFNGILLATGFPYETVYDISEYTLKYKDSTLNYTLVIMIQALIAMVLLTVVLSAKRIYRWFVKPRKDS